MPLNVTMKQPYSWIIKVDENSDIAVLSALVDLPYASRYRDCIAASERLSCGGEEGGVEVAGLVYPKGLTVEVKY